MNDEDRLAKLAFITAYFDDMADRVTYLTFLWQEQRQDEALTLCCCYIDAIGGQLYWDIDSSAHTFTKVLLELGCQKDLLWHSGLALARWLRKSKREDLRQIAKTLGALPPDELSILRTAPDLETYLARHIGHNYFGKVRNVLWRASIAYVCYEYLRNPFVHRMAGSGGIEIGPPGSLERVIVGFPTLYAALQAMLTTVRKMSDDEAKFFGHDFPKSKPRKGTT
jgi:hypothetical protein